MALHIYNYIGYKENQTIRHQLIASNEQEAIKLLNEKAITPLKIWTPHPFMSSLTKIFQTLTLQNRYSNRLKSSLCYNLYHQMLDSESTTQAIADVIDSVPNKIVKAKLFNLLALLNEGHTIGEAIGDTLSFLDIDKHLLSKIKNKQAILAIFKFLSEKYQHRTSKGATLFLSVFILLGFIIMALLAAQFVAQNQLNSAFTDIWILGREIPKTSQLFHTLFSGNIIYNLMKIVIALGCLNVFLKIIGKSHTLQTMKQFIFFHIPFYKTVYRSKFYIKLLETMQLTLLSGQTTHDTLKDFLFQLRHSCLRKKSEKALFYLESGRSISICLLQLGVISPADCHQLESLMTRPNTLNEMTRHAQLIEKKLHFQEILFQRSIQLLLIGILLSIIGFTAYVITETKAVLIMGM